MRKTFLATILVFAATFPALAQATKQDAPEERSARSGELFDTVARLDQEIFGAFNAHDLDRLMSMFTEDVEFFQDNDGLKNHAQTKEDFGKLFASVPDIRRDIVLGTLEVHPIKDYGAIEIGEHRFCHKENGKDDCGTFKFLTIWRKSGESWKISRVVSYGH